MRSNRRNIGLFLLLIFFSTISTAHAARSLYVAPNGNDSNDGLSPGSALATLDRAHALVDFAAYGDHTIYIRGGTYRGVSVKWTKTSPDHKLIIRAYNNEQPVFDGINAGEMAPYFFGLLGGDNQCTNVTIRDLKIRHYLHYGILLSARSSGWQGCNTIENNEFLENGDLYLPSPLTCSDELMGYGTIDLVNSRYNVIRNNVIVKSEDCATNAAHMHALYLAHGSSHNKIYNNYIAMTSGDPMRVRDASNNNHFYNNYVDTSGRYAFISGYSNTSKNEQTSRDNVIENNTITFPYPSFSSIALTCTSSPCDNSHFVDRGQRFFYGVKAAETVGAMTSGDFNGDGQSEQIVALNYSHPFTPNFTKVVRTTGGSDRHLSKLLYLSTSYSIHAMSSGDYDGNGTDEVLTFLRRSSDGRSEIYSGNGRTSILNNGRLYWSDYWDILAMGSGDFNGDGKAEVITSFMSPGGENRLYRGDGSTTITGFGRIYTSTYWRVTSLTAGDFDTNGKDELVSAFHSPDVVRLYKGNGLSSAINYGYFYSSPYWTIPAVSAGYFESTSYPTLVTSFKLKSTGETRIYHGSDKGAAGSQIYSSTSWDARHLSSGQFNNGSTAELVTAFTASNRTQIWASNGTTRATGAGIFHRWPR